MCKILRNIQGKTADEILATYGQGDSVPVDLKQLLLNIGMSALPLDFASLEKEVGCNKGDILGLVLSKGENAAIFYKKDDTLNRQRFTIAHELAHCCLNTVECDKPHIEFRWNENEIEEYEIKANIFAGQLLIPIKKLSEVYLKLEVPNSATLASKFGVSINVMEARLKYLKISYFNKNGQAVVYENE